MVVFADSSAVVKLYAEESGAEEAALVFASSVVLVSALCRVEVPAALWRKQRLGHIEAHDASLLVQAFEHDLFGSEADDARFTVVAINAVVLDVAAELAARHGLRAYDAVQLAGALAAHEAIGDDLTFAGFDQELNAAAARERLPLAFA